jgi:hypothetical protein
VRGERPNVLSSDSNCKQLLGVVARLLDRATQYPETAVLDLDVGMTAEFMPRSGGDVRKRSRGADAPE